MNYPGLDHEQEKGHQSQSGEIKNMPEVQVIINIPFLIS